MDLCLETKLSEKAALKEYDKRALTKEEQDQLNQVKVRLWCEAVASLSAYTSCFNCAQIKTRIDSEKYLRSHPEIHDMMACFIK